MAFTEVIRTEKFPRNEHVDIHVRTLVLNADAPEADRVSAVEIREYIKEGEVYGHGLVLPAREVKDLIQALGRVSR